MNIKKDINIWKFCFYGFFKNLKFFEPFLYIFFIKNGYSFLQIGGLISLREIIRNIFEIPSGIYADQVGRKKSLKMCFIFYICSFVLFYFGAHFLFMAFAMVFYGLGDAFRSGTHKAIILTYLDQKGQAHRKVEVYGRTKSFSLLGSSLSALIGGWIVFVQSNYRLIFLCSIIPYIIDYLLIASYPDDLDDGVCGKFSMGEFFLAVRANFINLKRVVELRKGLINSGIFDGYFDVLKDYLQPILKAQIFLLPVFTIYSDQDKMLAILLGLAYFFINLITSFTTRNAYRLQKYVRNSESVLNSIFLITALMLGSIGLLMYAQWPILIIFLYLLLYVLRNVRRPFMLDYIATVMDRTQRASMLSIESQLKTVVIVIMAPVLGWVADHWGIWLMFGVASLSLIGFYFITSVSTGEIKT